MNNAEWLTKLGAIEFMRDVGKHFTVNAMLAKESVKRRIESEEGISYTEFSYSLLQAYDFLVLHERFGCTLQMGGSDQWGNITAGMDLDSPRARRQGVRARAAARHDGCGHEVRQDRSGHDLARSERYVAVRVLSVLAERDDRDAVRYLKFFTFLDAPRIESSRRRARASPRSGTRSAQLAREVTRLVHGDAAVREAEAAAEKLFGGDLRGDAVRELSRCSRNVPSSEVPYAARAGAWRAAARTSGVASSNGEATRLIRSGGIYVNERRITDEKERLRPEQAIHGRYFVVRKGKRTISSSTWRGVDNRVTAQ